MIQRMLWVKKARVERTKSRNAEEEPSPPDALGGNGPPWVGEEEAKPRTPRTCFQARLR